MTIKPTHAQTKTTRLMHSRPTTRQLTLPLAYQPMARAILGGTVVLLVLFAFAQDAVMRYQETTQPAVAPAAVVYVIATPTALPVPTAAPPAPTAAPLPTPEPVIIYQEVPVYVQAAPQVDAAPQIEELPTEPPAPTPLPPLLVGETLAQYFERTGVTPETAKP